MPWRMATSVVDGRTALTGPVVVEGLDHERGDGLGALVACAQETTRDHCAASSTRSDGS